MSEDLVPIKLGLMPDISLDKKTINGAAMMKGGPRLAPQYWTALAGVYRRTFFLLGMKIIVTNCWLKMSNKDIFYYIVNLANPPSHGKGF